MAAGGEGGGEAVAWFDGSGVLEFRFTGGGLFEPAEGCFQFRGEVVFFSFQQADVVVCFQ